MRMICLGILGEGLLGGGGGWGLLGGGKRGVGRGGRGV